MRIFSSNSTHKIDAKGRVSIPAGFRKVIEREEDSGLIYLIPQLRNDLAIEGMGSARFEQLAESIDSMSPLDEHAEALAAKVLGNAKPHQIDDNGRIVLAADIRDQFGLRDEALFVGLGRTFQIWEPSAWAARQGEIARLAREGFAKLPWGPTAARAGQPS